MTISHKEQHQVFEILNKIINKKPMNFQTIIEAVNAEIVIEKEEDIRGVLYYMINKKMISRVHSVIKEQYYLI